MAASAAWRRSAGWRQWRKHNEIMACQHVNGEMSKMKKISASIDNQWLGVWRIAAAISQNGWRQLAAALWHLQAKAKMASAAGWRWRNGNNQQCQRKAHLQKKRIISYHGGARGAHGKSALPAGVMALANSQLAKACINGGAISIKQWHPLNIQRMKALAYQWRK